MQRTISFMNGQGSIGHNSRAFIADNVNPDRTEYNESYFVEDIKEVYHHLFDEALAEYNAKQKRKDRQIKNYYEKIKRSKQEKLFYEVIVQIGNRDDTYVGSDEGEIAKDILRDYLYELSLVIIFTCLFVFIFWYLSKQFFFFLFYKHLCILYQCVNKSIFVCVITFFFSNI